MRRQKRQTARVEQRTQKVWNAKRRATYSSREAHDSRRDGSSGEGAGDADSLTRHTTISKNTASSAQEPSKEVTDRTRLPVHNGANHQHFGHSKIPRATAEKLAEDDAEIEALERALCIKSGKKKPRSFQQDGLDELLGSIEGSDTDLEREKKRKGELEWLQGKRKKVKLASRSISSSEGSTSNDGSENSDGNPDAAEDVLNHTSSSSDNESFASFEDVADINDAPKKLRENPYVPPEPPTNVEEPKYIPPSMRSQSYADHESLWRLERQIKGALNRLSEANLLAIVSEFEDLYRQNPRQHVFSLLLDALYGLICNVSTLQDTFMILHAGFVAALHKTLGGELAARVIERFVEEFERTTSRIGGGSLVGKEQLNLISFLAVLYNFRVIGSALIYDYIRDFLSDFSEEHTELLLKTARSKCGKGSARRESLHIRSLRKSTAARRSVLFEGYCPTYPNGCNKNRAG